MVILLSIVVAIFTAPVNLLVDFLFCEVLSAPTADSLKIQTEDTALKRAGRRMSNAVRRASVSVAKTASSFATSIKRGSRKVSSLQPSVTRLMPNTTVEAHALVHSSASIKDMMLTAQQSNDAIELNRRSTAVRVRRPAMIKGRAHFSEHPTKPEDGTDMKKFTYYQNDTDMNETFLELCDDMQAQRRLLKRSEVDAFDMKWGYML